jgi:hypothetical protein
MLFFVDMCDTLMCYSRVETILSSKGISVAPPERPPACLSQLPFAAPQPGSSRVRLQEEKEDIEEEEEDEDGSKDEISSFSDNEQGRYMTIPMMCLLIIIR